MSEAVSSVPDAPTELQAAGEQVAAEQAAAEQRAAEREPLRDRAAAALRRARGRTELLTDCLGDDELVAQHSPLMSPLVWDLAHIGNQEDIWLVRAVGGRAAVRKNIDSLYNAFEHPRADRPALPLLDPSGARNYAREVREQAWEVLRTTTFEGARLTGEAFAFGMIAQHEQQHDETMLATHQLREGRPALHAEPTPAPAARLSSTEAPPEAEIPGGPFTMGTSQEPWALDNERPAHAVDVGAFAIETVPVTNGRFRQFIDDGGYTRPELWSERGWAHRCEAELAAPLFWRREGDRRLRRRFGEWVPVDDAEPVVHVSYFEAEAFARWAGKRLPTEAEWEKAARYDPAAGCSRRYPWGDDDPEPRHANLGQRHLQPAQVGAYPDGASALGVQQLIGDVWEWTSSGFHAYPGFEAFPYREYSEVFFGGDYKVLRGGSFGTDAVACRGTFRNWDHPIRRQIFAGLRLARDV